MTRVAACHLAPICAGPIVHLLAPTMSGGRFSRVTHLHSIHSSAGRPANFKSQREAKTESERVINSEGDCRGEEQACIIFVQMAALARSIALFGRSSSGGRAIKSTLHFSNYAINARASAHVQHPRRNGLCSAKGELLAKGYGERNPTWSVRYGTAR